MQVLGFGVAGRQDQGCALTLLDRRTGALLFRILAAHDRQELGSVLAGTVAQWNG